MYFYFCDKIFIYIYLKKREISSKSGVNYAGKKKHQINN